MTKDVVNRWFHILDESATLIADRMCTTFLEGIIQTAENIVESNVNPVELREKLRPMYQEIYEMEATPEQVRKAFQLVVLKGMKDSVQPQHQMTPDAVAIFMGYLINKLPLEDGWTCLDIAVGTGNLLTAVLNQANKKVGFAAGVDIDDLLMKLSVSSVNLQQHAVELHHQDSLRPLLVDPVDVTLSDLPYGYYFDEENAKHFQVSSSDNRPMSHPLFIEQALKYTKPAGFLFFIIPNDLFQLDEDKKLSAVIHKEATILGLLQLPISMFKDKNQAKSILILQKKGPETKPPTQVLLAELPSFKNRGALASIMVQIDKWFTKNFPKNEGV